MIDLSRMNEKDYLFNVFAGIARAHAIAMVPNFLERERLALLAREHREKAAALREEMRQKAEQAFECEEEAKRITEQLKAL